MSETKREMTPEIRKKLEGYLPVSKNKGVPFTPDYFLNDEELKPYAPVFMQRGWTQEERASAITAIKEKTYDGDTMEELARVTVLGFKNCFDLATKEEVKFVGDDKGSVSKDVWREFPYSMRHALYQNAEKLSGIGLSNVEKESLES